MFLHNLNHELLPLCWPKFKYFQISSNFVSLHLWNQLIKLCEIMIIHNRSNVLLNVRWYYKLLCKMASETRAWRGHVYKSWRSPSLHQSHIAVQNPVHIKTYKQKSLNMHSAMRETGCELVTFQELLLNTVCFVDIVLSTPFP